MLKRVLVLNGPNLNLLGVREPQVYGHGTLAELQARCTQKAQQLGLSCDFVQSNEEGALINAVHAALGEYDAIIINAGAYTHTSIALRDALVAVNLPFIEVHLSNVYAREAFRHHSYLSDQAKAVVCGMGVLGYLAALEYVAEYKH